MAGKLIVFEGTDGSGKSTQFARLCERVSAMGKEYQKLTFPQYSEPSSALIRMYLGGEFGEKPGDVNAFARGVLDQGTHGKAFIKMLRALQPAGKQDAIQRGSVQAVKGDVRLYGDPVGTGDKLLTVCGNQENLASRAAQQVCRNQSFRFFKSFC